MQPRRKTITQEANICKAPEVAEEEFAIPSLPATKGKYNLSILGYLVRRLSKDD